MRMVTGRSQQAPKMNLFNAKMLGFQGAFWWAGSESNTRHEDFQSSALPTELPAHRDCKCRGFATVLIRTCPDSPLQQPSGCASPVLSTALCGIALLLECRDPRLDEIDHLGLEVGLIH